MRAMVTVAAYDRRAATLFLLSKCLALGFIVDFSTILLRYLAPTPEHAALAALISSTPGLLDSMREAYPARVKERIPD